MAAPAAPWLQNERRAHAVCIGAPRATPGVSANQAARAFMAAQDEIKAKARARSDADLRDYHDAREYAEDEDEYYDADEYDGNEVRERIIFIRNILKHMPLELGWDAEGLARVWGREVDYMLKQYSAEGGIFVDSEIQKWLEVGA